MKKCKNVVAVRERERERELYFRKIKSSLISEEKKKIEKIKKDSDINHVKKHGLYCYLFVL